MSSPSQSPSHQHSTSLESLPSRAGRPSVPPAPEGDAVAALAADGEQDKHSRQRFTFGKKDGWGPFGAAEAEQGHLLSSHVLGACSLTEVPIDFFSRWFSADRTSSQAILLPGSC
jgi:hypothetical protein